jgi:hypothetical protein
MRKKPDQNRWPKGPSTRALRYGWAIGVSGLLAMGLLAENDSAWLPLINHAIDLMQQQPAPSQNR